MNTVPYTNARREGRTTPGLIEMINPEDPRHPMNGPRLVPNRADRRRRHRGVAIRKSAAARRLHRPEWPPTATDAEKAALLERRLHYQAERWARRGIRFAYCHVRLDLRRREAVSA